MKEIFNIQCSMKYRGIVVIVLNCPVPSDQGKMIDDVMALATCFITTLLTLAKANTVKKPSTGLKPGAIKSKIFHLR